MSEKKKRKRYEIQMTIPFAVKAESEEAAALLTMRWLLDALLSARQSNEITIYPPLPYTIGGNEGETRTEPPTTEDVIAPS